MRPGMAVRPCVILAVPLLILAAILVCCCGSPTECPTPTAVEDGDRGGRAELPDREVLDLVVQLNDPNYEVRLQALKRLTKVGVRASTAGSAIVDALSREQETWMRGSYVDLLAATESAEAPVLDLYAALLEDEELYMRNSAARGIKKLGKRSRVLLPQIVRAFERDPELHTWLLGALQALVPDSKIAVPAVLDAMREHDFWPGGLFLGDLGAEGAVAIPELLVILEDPTYSDELRGVCAHAMGRIGDRSPAVLKALQAAQYAGIEAAGDALKALGAK